MKDAKKSYSINVELEIDEDNPKWKHADITIKLEDESLNSDIWRKSSIEVKKFYTSIENKKLILLEVIKNIHKFIYILSLIRM